MRSAVASRRRSAMCSAASSALNSGSVLFMLSSLVTDTTVGLRRVVPPRAGALDPLGGGLISRTRHPRRPYVRCQRCVPARLPASATTRKGRCGYAGARQRPDPHALAAAPEPSGAASRSRPARRRLGEDRVSGAGSVTDTPCEVIGRIGMNRENAGALVSHRPVVPVKRSSPGTERLPPWSTLLIATRRRGRRSCGDMVGCGRYSRGHAADPGGAASDPGRGA